MLRRPRKIALGIRWWLAGAFGVVSLTTAVVVVVVGANRSERAFRDSAVELAVGHTVVVAEAVSRAQTPDEVRRAVRSAAAARALALFVVDRSGALVASASPAGISYTRIDRRRAAVAAALGGARFIRASDDGSATLVAVPVYGREPWALVSYTARPEVRKQLGIVRQETLTAALWATLIGGAVGFVVAQMIALRLRRIAATARAIEEGNFDAALESRFPDEVGRLAASIDAMRRRLRDSFAAIAADRDRLDRLLARLAEGVVAVRPDGSVDFVNEAARRILRAPDLGPGDPLPEPWPEVSLRDIALALFADATGVLQIELRPNEREAYALNGAPAGDGADSVMLVFFDLSEHERHERAQREFVTNAAHELRNPIAAIMTSVEMLQSGAKDDLAARDEFLSHIESEAARLGRLTRALLVLSRSEAAEPGSRAVTVPLRDLLEETAAYLPAAPGVAVRVECEPDLAVRVDRDLLEQALSAVTANAAKYTSRGEIVLRGGRSDGVATLEVADTGPGIEASEAINVFDRFYRVGDRDRTGFGLGLAIARQSVRLLGGAIEVDETPGGGTTVRLEIPRGAT